MTAQQSMFGEASTGAKQPWVVTFRDGSTMRVGATSKWEAIRETGKPAKTVVSCEPATLSLFGGT
jgi:hypothetical protein